MYKSTEIRWFMDKEVDPVIQWFARYGVTFGQVKKRTDHYLCYPQEDIGIKLREGRAEVKYRTGEPVMHHLGTSALGYLEKWTKWSFDIADDDAWSTRIIRGEVGTNEWSAVEKQRLGLKRTYDDKGGLVFVDISEDVRSACQVEFTRLLIGGRTSYTFGIEWFGEKEIPLEEAIVNEILEGAALQANQSMGYAAYLGKQNSS